MYHLHHCRFSFVGLLFFAAAVLADPAAMDPAQPAPNSAWSEQFRSAQPADKGIVLPQGWQVEGTKLGVPVTRTTIENDSASGRPYLKIECKQSTGGIICNPSDKVDLTKTPILRWRWRVLSYPPGADGRVPAKDDQPIAIYVGSNGWLKKKSIAYRWETETPAGFEGTTSYAGGMLKVHFITLRDKNTKPGEWVTETRNLAQDFKKAYGEIPKEFALSIMANSQYTKSDTTAEIAFIEFLPENQ